MKVCSQCAYRYGESDRTHCPIDGAPLVASPDPRLGSVLAGRYRLERLLGEGGMGTVYRARHLLVDRPFAVKILRAEISVKLVDFGLARSSQDSHLTSAGEILGTPQYMAPERALRADVDASSDLYSLGVMLYEMVAGRLPFESNSATGFVLKHLHEA